MNMAESANAAQATLPPGPKTDIVELAKDILFGDVALVSDPLKYFRGLHAEFGDLVYSDFGIGRFYFTDNLALIRRIFVSEPRSYAKASAYKEAALFLGNGILNSEGDFWQTQRSMVQPAFSKSKLATFAQSMFKTTDAALDHLGRATDVSELSMHIALENICKFLFGRDFSAHEKVIREAVHFGNDFISRRIQMPIKLSVYLPFVKNLRFFFHRFELDQILYKIIDARLAEPATEPRDLLGMLISGERENSGSQFRKGQVRDELITLLIAGHETTGFTLAMALWLLAVNTEIQDRLRSELIAVMSNEPLTPENLNNCPLLEAVVNETLRLYPAAWIIGRRTIADEIFEGHILKKDSEIQISIQALHRNKEYWSEPDRFNPDRFLGENPEPKQKQAYMPFGAGPRRCIGNVFALMEMQVAIAQTLLRYNLSVSDKREPKIEYMFTARLPNSLPVDFEPLAGRS